MFGIGAGEFFIIFIILLVVVGPERLPGLARQAGQILVRVRTWVQHSPDAAMVLRARQEIEQELAFLKSSLAEVQGVRDEVIEAAKQVQQTVQDEVIAPTQQIGQVFRNEVTGTRQQLQNALSGTQSAGAAAAEVSGDAATVAANAADAATDAANIAVEAAEAAMESAKALQDAVQANALPPLNPVSLDASNSADTSVANGQTVLRARSRSESLLGTTNRAEEQQLDARIAPSVSLATFEQLQRQMDVLLNDLGALRSELHQRGVIGDDLLSDSPAEDTLEPALATTGGNDVHE